MIEKLLNLQVPVTRLPPKRYLGDTNKGYDRRSEKPGLEMARSIKTRRFLVKDFWKERSLPQKRKDWDRSDQLYPEPTAH